MKIILPWPSSAIRFFLKKKNSLVAYGCHNPQCTWADLGHDIFYKRWRSSKSNQEWWLDASSNAWRWFIEESLAKLENSEILESKYPMYEWRKRTLAPMLQYFDIKFTNYEVDIEDVKEAGRWDPKWNLYWRMFVLGLTSIYETINWNNWEAWPCYIFFGQDHDFSNLWKCWYTICKL